MTPTVFMTRLLIVICLPLFIVLDVVVDGQTFRDSFLVYRKFWREGL